MNLLELIIVAILALQLLAFAVIGVVWAIMRIGALFVRFRPPEPPAEAPPSQIRGVTLSADSWLWHAHG